MHAALSGQPEYRTGPEFTSGTTRHTISPVEYRRFCRYLEGHCGITLGKNREYLVASRLGGLIAESGIADFQALLTMLEGGGNSGLATRVIDAMTTNETSWFRDVAPFEIMKACLFPDLLKQSGRAVRIWSAASSTGQEPYSIAMLMQEFRRQQQLAGQLDIRIIATDISTRVLALARQGLYDNYSIGRGLSDKRLRQFFVPTGSQWQISEDIRRCVEFRQLNLLQSYAPLGLFDIVVCRNVLIYFPAERKRDILQRMAAALKPGGYLFIGTSEVVPADNTDFELLRCPQGVVYKKRP